MSSLEDLLLSFILCYLYNSKLDIILNLNTCENEIFHTQMNESSHK